MKNYNDKQQTIITCDVCVIGAGAAGLSAALFAARRGYRVFVVTADIGGQTSSTAEIENYPGLGQIEGPALMASFKEEALSFGVQLIVDEVASLEPLDEGFLVSAAHARIGAASIIVATGKSPRRLGVPREEDFLGKGLLYSGLANAEECRDKNVLVVGGGNSALTALVQTGPFAKTLTLVHRRDTVAGEKILCDRVNAMEQIVTMFSSTIVALSGTDHLESVIVRDSDGGDTEVPVDMLIVAIGFEMRNDWITDAVRRTDDSSIVIDGACGTSVKGVFAAGDCTIVPYHQIVISAGEGAKAGLSACRYLDLKSGKRSPRTDWGFM